MNCNSNYLKDINNSNSYEGAFRFTLYSKDDLLVGQKCCKNQCSEIRNSKIIAKNGFDHYTILIGTINIQYNILYYKTIIN